LPGRWAERRPEARSADAADQPTNQNIQTDRLPRSMPPDDEQVDLNSIPIRVLIVDDDEAHAQTVAEILERVGAQCTVCTSGWHAVSIIEGESFDVVITDMKMDEVDG